MAGWVRASVAVAVLAAGACEPSRPSQLGASQAWTNASGAPSVAAAAPAAPAEEERPMTPAEPRKREADPAFEGTSGVTEKTKPDANLARLKDVRTGHHEGYDRVVFEFEGSVPGYKVEYVEKPVRDCGSGEAREVAGEARLMVRIHPAAAHAEKGGATVKDRHRRVQQPSLRQLDQVCDNEGHVDWVLGVESRTPYRVLELTAPPRLVVDVRNSTKVAPAEDPG